MYQMRCMQYAYSACVLSTVYCMYRRPHLISSKRSMDHYCFKRLALVLLNEWSRSAPQNDTKHMALQQT